MYRLIEKFFVCSFVLIGICIGLVMLDGDRASACSCAIAYTLEESFEHSDVVLDGILVSANLIHNDSEQLMQLGPYIYSNPNALNLAAYTENIEEPYSPQQIKSMMISEDELKSNIEKRKNMILTTFIVVGVLFIVTAGLLMYRLSRRMKQ